jgi:CRP/FNR family transcriptional regulator, cyclic AMP receptor protein
MIHQERAFNPSTFLTTSEAGRKLINFTKGQAVYAQGDAANSLFVIQNGSVKLSIRSQTGKETILDILSEADFVGSDSLSGVSSRAASAECTSCFLRSIACVDGHRQHPSLWPGERMFRKPQLRI